MFCVVGCIMECPHSLPPNHTHPCTHTTPLCGEQVATTVTVPVECVGVIIGRGGASISALRASTGCSFTVLERAPGAVTQVLRVVGPDASAVAAAVAAVEAKVAGSRSSSSSSSAGQLSATKGPGAVAHITVPCAVVGLVKRELAASGVLQARGTVMDVQREVPAAVDRAITVSGPDSASVQATVTAIRTIVHDAYAAVLEGLSERVSGTRGASDPCGLDWQH